MIRSDGAGVTDFFVGATFELKPGWQGGGICVRVGGLFRYFRQRCGGKWKLWELEGQYDWDVKRNGERWSQKMPHQEKEVNLYFPSCGKPPGVLSGSHWLQRALSESSLDIASLSMWEAAPPDGMVQFCHAIGPSWGLHHYITAD